MESLKIIGMVLFIGVVYSFMGDDDYHKRFDKPSVIRYDCTRLDRDAPQEIVDRCIDANERIIRVTTYKE